jgi:hypothetical protein
MSGQLPDFIGIGASKSATSWIAKCLDEHPAICMYSGKEARFFLSPHYENQGWQYYASLFDHCTSSQLCGEFSTHYFDHSHEVAPRIYEYVPYAKLIVSLRDPVARMRSSHFHGRSKGRPVSFESFLKRLEQEPGFLERRMYSAHLKEYLRYFPRHQIHVLLYDDILRDPLREVQHLYAFLGVDSSFVPHGIDARYNSTHARMSPYFRTLNKMYLKARKNKFGRGAVQLGKAIGVDGHTVEWLLRRSSNRVQKQQLSYEQERRLRSLFQDDICELEQLLERDLSHWYEQRT